MHARPARSCQDVLVFTKRKLKAAAAAYERVCAAWDPRITQLGQNEFVALNVTPTRCALYGIAGGKWVLIYVDHDGNGGLRNVGTPTLLDVAESDLRTLIRGTLIIEVDRNRVQLGYPPQFNPDAEYEQVLPSSPEGMHSMWVLGVINASNG